MVESQASNLLVASSILVSRSNVFKKSAGTARALNRGGTGPRPLPDFPDGKFPKACHGSA